MLLNVTLVEKYRINYYSSTSVPVHKKHLNIHITSLYWGFGNKLDSSGKISVKFIINCIYYKKYFSLLSL